MDLLRIEQTEAERERALAENPPPPPVMRNGNGSGGGSPMRAVRTDLPTDAGELHLLISELEGDRDFGRIREAMWISIIVHLMLFLLFLLAPRIFPHAKVALLTPAQELDQSRFLELPPDAQKYLAKPPKTSIQSDKNRIAESKQPTPDKQTLEELERMRARGAPGAQRQRAPAQMAAQQPQAEQPATQQPTTQQQQPPQPTGQTMAQLRPQPPAERKPNPFGAPQSAGSAIQDAIRAAANGRGAGQSGDYGEGLQPHAGVQGNAQILSDTEGVDFGPYMARVIAAVRRNWYAIIPEEAMPPLNKTGKLAIEFSILKNGSVGDLRVVYPSGDIALDRAAQGGITGSNPFAPLPSQYKKDRLQLRFFFFYLGPNGKLQ